MRVPELLESLEADLCKPRRIPSRTSLYRHRLTVHIGLCRWLAASCLPILLDEEGFCRWGTLDASPQGAWDWVLSGATLVAGSQLRRCFEDANQLIALGRSDTAAEEDNISQQHVLARQLAESLCVVQGTPAAVGSGRAGLLHKVHALAHSTRLSAPDWKSTCDMLNGTLTWTADLGVESGLNSFKGNVCTLFGDWAKAEALPDNFAQMEHEAPFDFQDAVPVGGQEQVFPEKMRPFNLDFNRSIYIPGPLHIMHNLTENLKTAMVWWESFIARLTHLCRLLQKKWNRSRLLATCFSDPPWNAFVDLYNAFDGCVYEGRWGSVLFAVKELMPLEASLRGAWSRQKFVGPGGGAGLGKSLDMDLIDDACSSNLFWAYLEMVNELGQTMEHVMFWCESRPCHGHDAELQGDKKHSKSGLFSRLGMYSCPLAARRAPEFATGQIEEIVREGFRNAHARLLLSPKLGALSAEDQQVVVGDCSHARRYTALVVTLKFVNWKQLPWILMGIAHHNIAEARQCAARSLDAFSASAGAQRHHLSRLLCTPGTQGPDEMTRFVAGEPLQSLPLLYKFACRFKFTPTCERWIESRHALLKRHLRKCTHASAQHIAFLGCQPVLRDLMLRQPSEFKQLVTQCASTKNPRLALHSVGLDWHPKV